MNVRSVIIKPVISEKMSRPAELVQRAKQLSQLATFQFGRTTVTPAAQPATTTNASVANCMMRRSVDAPSAPRTAISRRRPSERTRMRLATFT